jgi:replicative DNA helicase
MSEARTLPHSLDSERVVLSMSVFYPDVRGELMAQVRPEHFYQPQHRAIWDIITELVNTDQPVELSAIGEFAHSHGMLDRIGGFVGLAEATDCQSSTPGYYADIMQRNYMLRELIAVGRGLIDSAYSQGAEPSEVIGGVVESLTDLRTTGTTSSEVMLADSAQELVGVIEERLKTKGSTGVSTGFPDLDQMVGGLRAGQLVVVAARPGVGKSALALNIAQAVAEAAGPALFVSLEMSHLEQTERVIGYESGIGSSRLQKAELTRDDRTNLFDAINSVANIPLMFLDNAFDLESITNKCRAIHGKRGLKLIVADYLQLCEVNGIPESQRERAVAKMSRTFKRLAQELQLPVIALSQLNRDVEKRQSKRPMLSDLRESGAIEQDANVVLFLHRPDMYDADDRPGETEVIVGKNRNGDTGIVSLRFQKELTRFESQPVYEGSL